MRKSSRLFAALLFGPLAATLAPPTGAEIVVLTEGSFLKVADFQVNDRKVHLELPGGGRMTLPLSRVERIVDDEIVPEPEVPFEAPVETVAVALGFAEGQGVPQTPYGEMIFEIARRHDLNPAFVSAVVRAESAYDAGAVSSKGARGLMQLMPATARRFGLRDHEVFQAARNIETGTRYLKWLAERFDGDLPRILAAYNAGEGTVDRYGGVPPYRETRNYIRRIYRFLGLSPAELSL